MLAVHVASVDQGFVAAPPAEVFARLAGGWGEGERRLGRFRVRPRETGRREGIGLTSRLEGDVAGTLEWYLEPFEEGTIVYAILHLEPRGGPRRSARALLRARGSLRRTLVGMKHALEGP